MIALCAISRQFLMINSSKAINFLRSLCPYFVFLSRAARKNYSDQKIGCYKNIYNNQKVTCGGGGGWTAKVSTAIIKNEKIKRNNNRKNSFLQRRLARKTSFCLAMLNETIKSRKKTVRRMVVPMKWWRRFLIARLFFCLCIDQVNILLRLRIHQISSNFFYSYLLRRVPFFLSPCDSWFIFTRQLREWSQLRL